MKNVLNEWPPSIYVAKKVRVCQYQGKSVNAFGKFCLKKKRNQKTQNSIPSLLKLLFSLNMKNDVFHRKLMFSGSLMTTKAQLIYNL